MVGEEGGEPIPVEGELSQEERWGIGEQTTLHITHYIRTCTCITTARIGYVVPIQGMSQQEATRLVALLVAGTPASYSQLYGPLSAVGVLIYGLARLMR